MDASVSLVQAYLQVNGYFTVAEYPVIEPVLDGGTRTVTDLDILAFRFPRAGAVPGRRRLLGSLADDPDPKLGVPAEQADMIVGEVKRGSARFNAAARNPLVLEAALVRFGCCPASNVSTLVRKLLKSGHAATHAGHLVRMIAFGSTDDRGGTHHSVVTMGHIVEFLQSHLRQNWAVLGRAQLSQPALSYLALLEKAERGMLGRRETQGTQDE